MLVGVPKEIKNHEYRVAITPAGVVELIKNGHQVIVEKMPVSGLLYLITNMKNQAPKYWAPLMKYGRKPI